MRIIYRCFFVFFFCLWFFLNWSVNDFLKYAWSFHFFKLAHWQFLWNEMQHGWNMSQTDVTFFVVLFIAIIFNLISLALLSILIKKTITNKSIIHQKFFIVPSGSQNLDANNASPSAQRPQKLKNSLSKQEEATSPAPKIKPPKERPAPANGYRKISSTDTNDTSGHNKR